MKKLNNSKKRALRTRKKIKSVSTNRYRISIFKSLKNISAQIIDDKEKKTIIVIRFSLLKNFLIEKTQ